MQRKRIVWIAGGAVVGAIMASLVPSSVAQIQQSPRIPPDAYVMQGDFIMSINLKEAGPTPWANPIRDVRSITLIDEWAVVHVDSNPDVTHIVPRDAVRTMSLSN